MRYFIYHYHPSYQDSISGAHMVKVEDERYDLALVNALDATRVRTVETDKGVEEHPKATRVEVYRVSEQPDQSNLEHVYTLYPHKSTEYTAIAEHAIMNSKDNNVSINEHGIYS